MYETMDLLEQDLSCAVCRDIFQDPVFLMCSHSFCRGCLQQSWRDREVHECPVCRERVSLERLPCNLVLKTLCEDYLLARGQTQVSTGNELMCRLHGERLKLFCQQDKELVCLVCRDSRKHTDHKFRPIDEAAQDLKDELKTLIKPLRENLTTYEGIQQTLTQRMKKLKSQGRRTAMQIKEEFQSLHQFLHDEETARIAALREEEEQNSYTMKKRREEMSYLAKTIEALEMEVKKDDVLFLQNYSSTIQRAQSAPQDAGKAPGKLINVATHLSNLKYLVWEKMRGIIEYTPVTLDPNTAHPCLTLSNDLTSLQLCTELQQPPDCSQSFGGYTSVLGSEGFASGTHYWDVEVRDCPYWALGVVSESESKNREEFSKFHLWYIGYANGKYGKGYSTELLTPLSVNGKPQRVRVLLDWDAGRVSFSDVDTGEHLHSFTHSFTEMVYPYFCNVSSVQPLRILGLKPLVNL